MEKEIKQNKKDTFPAVEFKCDVKESSFENPGLKLWESNRRSWLCLNDSNNVFSSDDEGNSSENEVSSGIEEEEDQELYNSSNPSSDSTKIVSRLGTSLSSFFSSKTSLSTRALDTTQTKSSKERKSTNTTMNRKVNRTKKVPSKLLQNNTSIERKIIKADPIDLDSVIDTLFTSKPESPCLDAPIALSQVIDLMIDFWEADGLYD